MLTTVIVFAALTALFEAVLLLKFSNEAALRKTWVRNLVHIAAILLNLMIHWGTIVGTMTAVTAGLVSFVTVPAVVYIMVWRTQMLSMRETS